MYDINSDASLFQQHFAVTSCSWLGQLQLLYMVNGSTSLDEVLFQFPLTTHTLIAGGAAIQGVRSDEGLDTLDIQTCRSGNQTRNTVVEEQHTPYVR